MADTLVSIDPTSMIAETMIPEAFNDSPRFSGLLAATGLDCCY
jgi:hypothetical protein